MGANLTSLINALWCSGSTSGSCPEGRKFESCWRNQMEKPQTSRHKLFDTEVRITELELLADHYIEILLGYESKRFLPVTRIDEEGNKTDDVIEEMGIDIKMAPIKEQLKKCISLRRDLMSQLQKEYGGDHYEWCPYKHSRKEFGLAKEDYVSHIGTEHEDFYFKALTRSFEIYTGSSSLFLGYEYVTCGRCLADKLDNA